MDQQAASVAPTSARILLAEDYKPTADSMEKLLRLLGHNVLVTHDGPQAIAAALSWRPEVILLDIGLPTMDGYEVAARLRQEPACQETLIIALTGYGQEQDRQRSLAAGIDHHLLKPVSRDVLQSLLSDSPLSRDA